MKIVPIFSSNCQIGMILVAKCSYSICVQLLFHVVMYSHVANCNARVLELMCPEDPVQSCDKCKGARRCPPEVLLWRCRMARRVSL